jgi:hypothetical protein
MGAQMFWELVHANVFHFIHCQQQPTACFPTLDAPSGGDIGMLGISAPNGGPLTIDEEIQRHLKPMPGRGTEVEDLFCELKACSSNGPENVSLGH